MEFKGAGIVVQMDSGAHEWVFNKATAQYFPVSQTHASANGIDFVAANGTPIQNYGQRLLVGYADNWTPITVNVQVAEVKSNLAAGMRVVQAGNRVVLDEGGLFCLERCQPPCPMLLIGILNISQIFKDGSF